MKTLSILVSSAAVFLLTGCGTAAGLFTPQTAQVQQVQTKQVSETNVVTVTNTVVTTLTNGVTLTNTVTQTNYQVQTVPVLVTNTVTVTKGYAVSGTVSNLVSGAQTINALSAPVNPFSSIIAAFLGLTTGALGYVASVKTKQAQQHLSTASTLITAVEGLAPAAAAGVKAAVQAQALKMGTTAQVQQTVQAVTQNLPSTS